MKRTIHNNPRGGFSLLELLIYTAVLSIVVMFVAGSFFTINQGRARVEAASEVNSTLRFAIERIGQDIKSASVVTLPATAGATSTSLQLTVSGSTISYCIADNVIRRQVGGACSGSSEALTGSAVIANSLLFSRTENVNAVLGKTITTIGVALNLSYNSTAPEWQYSSTKQTAISLY